MTPPLTSVLVGADTLRGKIHAKAISALTSVFPLDLKGRTLEVKDVAVHDRLYSSDEQKHALLGGGSLQNAVKGTLVLKGADGRVIDEAKNFTLVHLPYLTDRHTIIANGNEYQFANQIRRKPGVYTQRADNGELRTIFNLGKGKNFDVGFDETKGTFSLQYGTSNIPMYAVLRGLGATHEQIAHHLGEGVAKENQKASGHKIESAIGNLYQKLEHPAVYDKSLPHTAKLDAVQKRFAMTTLDPEVTEHTLGKRHDKVTPTVLLDAAKKILAVHQGKTAVDDTDSLAFKTFHSVDDFLAERIKLTARAWAPKARMNLSGKSVIREALQPAPFSAAIRKFVTTSTLTAVPSGINPLELLDHAVKVTALGEGGITSDRAIPFDARMTHSTHFGALDPIRTPESNHSGVDVRASIAAHRDDHGNLYTTVHDVKAGKRAFLKAGDLLHNVVAFPGQDRTRHVKAFVHGTVENVPWSKVTHEMEHVSHQYSPATNMIPMIHNIQGNRAIMGSKMGTQALPLLEREAPFVQVKSHLPGDVSFETVFGHMTVPTSPVHGTVEKIQDGYVWIRPHGEKKAEDRPVIEHRKLGPFQFAIEIKKGVAHTAEGKTTSRGSSEDYGHLPGYVGPDGDSLDFFVGHDPHGAIFSYEKQKKLNAQGELHPDAPWQHTDTKYVVGLGPKDAAEFHKNTEAWNSPMIRFANLKHYEGWDHLKGHIDQHHRSEKTAAPRIKVPFSKYLIHIDRPKGTVLHLPLNGQPVRVQYPTHYGFLPGHIAEDKAALDFFVGNDAAKQMGHVTFNRPDIGQGVRETKFMVGLSDAERDDVLHQFSHFEPAYTPIHSLDDLHQAVAVFERKGKAKTAEDRPTKFTKTLGPHTFNVEIAKGERPHGNYAYEHDYGHLPGYHGPDGDSLDFFVGDREDGHLVCADKFMAQPDGQWRHTDTKFMVGMNTPELQAHLDRVNSIPTIRYTNVQHFKDWDHLNEHIAGHHKTAGARSAVLITGNPKFIQNNPAADAFYAQIEDHLRTKGYAVSRDAGEPHTSPPAADLYVTHSRGADRLQYTPDSSHAVMLGSHREGAVNHPDDRPQAGLLHETPHPSHYVFTDAMRQAIDRAGGDVKVSSVRVTSKTLGPFTFKIDRPKGYTKTWPGGRSWTYPVDYGYVPKVAGEDDEGLDAFVGDDPHGHHESFLKLKPDGEGKLVPDETKFLLGVTAKERAAIYAFYGKEVAAKTVYEDFDSVAEAIKRFPGGHKLRYAEIEKEAGWRDWVAGAGMLIAGETRPAPFPSTTFAPTHTTANRGQILKPPLVPAVKPLGAVAKPLVSTVPELAAAHAAVVGASKPLVAAAKPVTSLVKPALRIATRGKLGEEGLEQDEEDAVKEAASRREDRGLVKVPYETNFPFPSKTYLHHDIQVKPGQTVQAGQRLGDSNYTREGTLALGKNLLVGYMPYHGMNSNDAVVISEGCAKRLTSEHMYRETYPLSSQVELSLAKHKAYYSNKVTPQQYAKLDDTGVVKAGSVVDPKDPLVLGLAKTQVQGVDLMLGRISKSLTKPYREVTLSWEHGTPGTVVEVFRNATQISILVKTAERMNIGDKLSGRYGNKGTVSKILPDHEMIQDEKGRPLDLLLTSTGVISRINPAQIIETAVGKVVEKTGKPIIYNNAEDKDAVKWARDLLKKHDIKDKEHLYDPILKRHIHGGDGKGVLVGRQFIYKLFKSTDTNFSGRGVGGYDVNEQPLKSGGDESAKGIGKMEFDSLIAHGARNLLQDAATVRGTKSDEFWKALQLGSPLPTPKPSFAFNKFTAMLEGAGIKVDKRGSKFKLLPMTDKGVMERSRGAIENKKTLIAKNLKPETGGLFDPLRTGGPQGTLYSHINLHESIPHPLFVDPVRRLLNLTQKEFEQRLHDHGGKWFHTQLSALDVDKKALELRAHMVKAEGPDLDNTVKQLKYLQALKSEKLAPHEAYMMSKVPVIPPVFRPILPDVRDPSQLMVSDANKLYAHLMDVNGVLRDTALPSDLGKHRQMAFHAVGAVFGMHEPEDDKLKKQEVKGFLQNIAGVGTPKGGFFQRKLMRRTLDTSGRGTAVPDVNLGMDEVGIPEQMLWQMLDKLVVARLVRMGYSALAAREMVDKKAPVARDAMLAESKARPVLINRAPTLHRWSIIAANPVPVQGKTIRVSPFIERGMNLDFDGDTLQVHVPVQHGAVEDAKKMTLSQMLLGDQRRNQLLAFPQHEAIMGFTLASQAKTTTGGPAHHFHTRAEALAAWRAGKLQLTDSITVGSEKKASLDERPSDEAALSSEDALFYYPAENVTGYGP